jgi:hypothetical protein
MALRPDIDTIKIRLKSKDNIKPIISAKIHYFIKTFPVYKVDYENSSPYYSGHETCDDRYENWRYSIRKHDENLHPDDTVVLVVEFSDVGFNTYTPKWLYQNVYMGIKTSEDENLVVFFKKLKDYVNSIPENDRYHGELPFVDKFLDE